MSIVYELWQNHRMNIALEEEYTALRYDFLVSEGLVNLTSEEKKEIYSEAVKLLLRDLNEVYMKAVDFIEMAAIKKRMDNIRLNKMDEKDKEEVIALSKAISIRRCFDNMDAFPYEKLRVDIKK